MMMMMMMMMQISEALAIVNYAGVSPAAITFYISTLFGFHISFDVLFIFFSILLSYPF